jgi:hypothetical protein
VTVARAQAPEVPAEVWLRIERAIRGRFGADRHYIARKPKRLHLEALAEASAEVDCQRLAKSLEVSVRRVQQLKLLR